MVKKHVWLTSLTNQMKKRNMERLVKSMKGLKGDFDWELVDSVLEVSVKANPDVLEEWREGDDMCQALLEIMKPEIDKIREEEKRIGIELGEKRGIELGEKRGEKRGIELGEKRGRILGVVEAFRELGRDNKEIAKILIQKYGVTEEEVLSYL